MDRSADKERDLAAAGAVMGGKIAAGDYDVYLCHNGKDKPKVKEIAEELMKRGILPRLDDWEFIPGKRRREEVEKTGLVIRTAGVFFGPHGLGNVQKEEMGVFPDRASKGDCSIIPVILPGVEGEPKMPEWLKAKTWVDLRDNTGEVMRHLIAGIKGERPEGPEEYEREL